MTRPAPPALTVRYDGSARNFAAGNDVVVGRDLRADVRVAHPLISRAHLILRFDQGRWLAIDNGSLNGMFVNNQRVPVVDITDGLGLNIGNPDGPRLTFDVGRHQGSVGTPPQTSSVPVAARPSASWPTAPPPSAYPQTPPPLRPQPGYPSTQQPRYPSAPSVRTAERSPQGSRAGRGPIRTRRTPMHRRTTPPLRRLTTPPPRSGRPRWPANKRATSRPACSRSCGRAEQRTCLPGRSRSVAPPTTTSSSPMCWPRATTRRWCRRRRGTEIRDNSSINGTFVNGARVDSAMLRDGDVVTIGNVDLVFAGGTLARRTETEAATRTGGLDVYGVTWTIEGNKTLLDNISLAARPGTLTAVIGPSGAGKSTFARLVAGYTHPTTGTVTFEGHDVHAEYASLRSRIGMVPQDDVVHGQLTVRQALMYAAELRLPPDTSRADREQVVNEVLEELEMTKHLDTRVDKLSGGQRKRASVALELLTGPSLLILDEPTSGLDPALDRQVMTMLRQLADAGRVVLVVTHSLTYLDVCDQVLLLAPGGKTAFCGPPSQIGPELGTTNWADIFSTVAGDPEAAKRRYLERHGPPPPPPATQAPADLGSPVHTSVLKQFSTIARRQMRLIVSDRGYFIFLALLPFIMACIVAVRARHYRLRSSRQAQRRTQPAGPGAGAAERRRHLHGHGVDHPRPDR